MIYLCIPTHDEAATLGVLMWKARKVMGAFGRDYRFLVLDDASTDDTPEVLARYRRRLPITVIRSERRIGYAASAERLLREAVAQASYPKRDCAVVLQADFTEDPEDLVPLVKTIEGGADIVAGCVTPDRTAPAPVRWARRLARLALGRAYRECPVSDPLSGFRAYRIVVLKKAMRELAEGEALLRSEGWASNVELLARLSVHARRVEEAPFEVRYHMHTRPTRVRPVATLLSLVRLRGSVGWRGPEARTA